MTETTVKVLTFENLAKDSACAPGVKYWKKLGSPEVFTDEQKAQMINEHPDYFQWCGQQGYSGFDTLPENLSVGGYLYLSGTAITSLPENLSVGGYLDLSGTAITEVPAHLKRKVIR